MRPSFLLCLAVIVFSSCRTPDAPPLNQPVKAGHWELRFDIRESGHDLSIPVRMSVDSTGVLTLHNNGERIRLDSLRWESDSFHVKLPLFQTFLHGRRMGDSRIVGHLSDPTRRPDYKIPFEATYIDEKVEIPEGPSSRLIYDASFSPGDTAGHYKAIAILDRRNGYVSGTFLTETGDYRYLQGRMDSANLWLSCFDGSHLFYFTGKVRGDSISEGLFCSGIHWSQPWEAKLNEQARLRDPDSLTFVIPGSGPFSFTAMNLDGEKVGFDQAFFKHKVTVVQLYGSWCPNCTDESIFLRSMYEKHGAKGLQIVPVAFERSGNLAEVREIISGQNKELRIPYETFVGGEKSEAGKTFPMLNRIMSFPTTLIVDRNGEVRKTHTGFYGPGTGNYHEHYTDRLELFILQLLAEG